MHCNSQGPQCDRLFTSLTASSPVGLPSNGTMLDWIVSPTLPHEDVCFSALLAETKPLPRTLHEVSPRVLLP